MRVAAGGVACLGIRGGGLCSGAAKGDSIQHTESIHRFTTARDKKNSMSTVKVNHPW